METSEITFATGCSGIGAPEIPWRGKPAEKCPRAPQYKAYGNSMCVNVIEWLGRGIAEELATPAPFEIHYPEQQTFNF